MDQLLLIAAVAAIEALIGGGIGMALWVGVQRRIERRDKEMDDLRTGNEELGEDLRRLRDEKFTQLIAAIGEKHEAFERRFAGEAAARREIDIRLRDDYVHRRELAQIEDSMRIFAKRFDDATKEISETRSVVNLIAANLKITIPGKAVT